MADDPKTVQAGRWERFRRYVRRHDTALAVIGSIIALSSFAVREEWKASISSKIRVIELAEAEADIRYDVSTLVQRLVVVTSAGHGHQFDVDRINARIAGLQGRAYAERDLLEKASIAPEDIGFDDGSYDLGFRSQSSDDAMRRFDTALFRESRYRHAVFTAVKDKIEHLRSEETWIGILGVAIFAFGWALGFASKIVGKDPETDDQS